MKTTILSHSDLLQRAPSIFTEEKYGKMSDDYRMVKSYDIVKNLTDLNFYPVQAMQTRVRSADKVPYTKHLIRMRHADYLGSDFAPTVGQEVPDVVFYNSHDGTAAYNISLAVFRFICSNGMIVKSSEFSSANIRHKGNNVLEQVVESVASAAKAQELLLKYIDKWKNTELDPQLSHRLAHNALKIKYGNPAQAPITAETLLHVRRFDDAGNNLWKVFNVIQENMMRGGQSSGLRGEKRLRTTRGIRGTSETIKFNQEFWNAAEDIYNEANNPVDYEFDIQEGETA